MGVSLKKIQYVFLVIYTTHQNAILWSFGGNNYVPYWPAKFIHKKVKNYENRLKIGCQTLFFMFISGKCRSWTLSCSKMSLVCCSFKPISRQTFHSYS